MKLTNLVTAPTKSSPFAAGQNEDKAAREARMKRFWADPQNAHLIPVGRLLSLSATPTQTLADIILSGDSVELDSVQVAGVALPLVPGYKLTLNNVAQVWGCPACHSAHGSGTYPSREATKKGLEANRWYYNAATKALFTISETCWSDYVKALGAATATRFAPPKQVVAPAPAPDSKGKGK